MDRIEKRFVTKKLSINDCNDGFAYISFKSEDIENGIVPVQTELGNNYPNPFNPTTTISYNIANESDVKLEVYNIRGQKVTTVVNERMQPGYHSVIWDGKDKHNKQVSSGVYFYRLKADHKTLTKKMMLLK
ncbi:MAG: T9SS type A sorting domain-containing protein [Candidatus Zophobacter franzmannii]|nr:T9SS type A sorting domain-containing protein [Candidatus Zophobacter franzmannii]